MVRSSAKTHKGGRALRIEPAYNEVFEALSEIGKIFADGGWLDFCRKLKVFHAWIAMAFAESFNGYRAKVGGLTFFIVEIPISEVFKLEIEGERLFKKAKVDEEPLNQFLKPDSQNPRWTSDERIFLVDVGFDLQEEIERKSIDRRKTGSREPEKNFPTDNKTQVNNEKPKIKFMYRRKKDIKEKAKTFKIGTKDYKTKNMKKMNVPAKKKTKERTDKRKGKRVLEQRKRINRLTNKLRLNAKAKLNPSIKSSKLMYVNSDVPVVPVKKQKVKFGLVVIDPLLQLAEVAEKVEAEDLKNRHVKKRKRN